MAEIKSKQAGELTFRGNVDAGDHVFDRSNVSGIFRMFCEGLAKYEDLLL